MFNYPFPISQYPTDDEIKRMEQFTMQQISLLLSTLYDLHNQYFPDEGSEGFEKMLLQVYSDAFPEALYPPITGKTLRYRRN